MKMTKKNKGTPHVVSGVVLRTSADSERVRWLVNALAKISQECVDVGLGEIPLGKLARHLLKLRHTTQSATSCA